MLEKAEQRSRALGITNASKFPLAECTVTSEATPAATTTTSSVPKASSVASSAAGKVVILDKATLSASPTKPLRHYAAVNKENLEMGIEINITSAQPIGVSFFLCRFYFFFTCISLALLYGGCFCACLCLGILLQLSRSLSLSRSRSVCVRVCVCLAVCLCLYFYARCRYV